MGKAGDTAKGALGGAATGATIGSVAGPWGTAIGGAAGGIIGGIGGYMNSKDDDEGFRDRAQIESLIRQGYAPGGIAMNAAPQAVAAHAAGSQLNLGNDPFRRGQLQQVGQLQRVASGQQQGAGELAAQRQIQQALAAQQAQARMARGGNAALAYRNAANQSAALGSTGAGMGQQAALQDQAQAQAALTGALGQGRGGDISVAGQNAGYSQQAALANAGFQNQTNLSNASLQAQNQALNSQNYLALLQSLQGMNATELTGQNAMNMANQQRNDALMGAGISAAGNIIALQQQRAGAQPAAAAPTSGYGMGGGDNLMNPSMASDERLKTDVTSADREIDDMLDKLSPKAGRYKDEKFGKGEWNWVMAQDMERSNAGKRVVFDTPEGKMLDVNKALSTALASAARLNARLRAVEGR